jgi:hypothetical protein
MRTKDNALKIYCPVCKKKTEFESYLSIANEWTTIESCLTSLLLCSERDLKRLRLMKNWINIDRCTKCHTVFS